MSDGAAPGRPGRDTPPWTADFARRTRDLVDQALRTPAVLRSSDSRATRRVPPIDGKFQLDQVVLDGNTDPVEIHVLFRWAGDQTLFGVREPVERDDVLTPVVGASDAEELAAMIVDSLEENLLAECYGVQNAIRDQQDSVTWLRWNPRH
jgi:hypothetical protein